MNSRVTTQIAKEAATLLGELIKLGRKQRRWSEANLAERAGISRSTVQKIERGDLGCAIGSVFEVATLVGVQLFNTDSVPLSMKREYVQDKIALLPQKIRVEEPAVFDDF